MPHFPSESEIEELRTLRTWLANSGQTYINTGAQVPNDVQFGLIQSFGDAREANRQFLGIRGDKTDTQAQVCVLADIGDQPGPDFKMPVTILAANQRAFAGADGNVLTSGVDTIRSMAFDPFYLPLFSDPGVTEEGFSWNHVTGKGSDHYYLGLMEMSNVPGLANNVPGLTPQERTTQSLIRFFDALNNPAFVPAADPVLVAMVWSATGAVKYIQRTPQQAGPAIITVPNTPPDGYFKWLPDPVDEVDFEQFFNQMMNS